MVRRTLAAALAATTVALVATAGELPADCPLTVVRVHYGDARQLAVLTAWTEPWEVDRAAGVALVEVDADGFGRLVATGLELEIDDKRTLELCTPRTRLADQRSGIPGFPCYRTVDETFVAAAALATAHPGLAEVVDVGDSWERTAGLGGDDLLVLRLTNQAVAGSPTGDQPPHGKPRLVVTSAIHAREYTTAELALRFAETLLDGHGSDPDATWLLDEHEVHLLLHTNPDGRREAETGASWRKNTNQSYCGPTSSSRGADLNRNFAFGWGCCGGSSDYPCDGNYRGASAGSEPEVQAVQDYLRAVLPDQRGGAAGDPAPTDATGVYLDLHSYSELVLWPWGYTTSPAPNATALATLGRRLAWFNGYEPGQSTSLYVTDGTTVDFGYGDLGVAAYTFELGSSFFQDCSSFEGAILPDNLEALRYLAKVARTPFQTPAGPEIVVAAATPAVVAPGEVVTLTATADDTRFSSLGGSEPTQAVAEVVATVDVPPWRVPTPPELALDAVDGAYDSSVEEASAALGTAGLDEGRHTVFLRARDASGAWGPVSAVFLWLLDPAIAPRVAGTVLDDATALPLEASVSAGGFATTSDAATGAYELILPAGAWTMSATADGYRSESVVGVEAVSGAVATVDFRLLPYTTVLEDDVEAGLGGWTATAPWAITDESSASPTHSWTDSPGGSYANYADTSLTSPVLDLSGVTGVSVSFAHSYATESGYDYCRLEVSADGGASWQGVASWDDSSNGWRTEEITMPQLDNAALARIRFRLTSDVSISYDGWHVDDLVVRGARPTGHLFTDGFESGATTAWTVP